ncbi:MAG: MBL fold metallo-hydrolase [Bacillaceae bacterium]|nr:MBL fold metallo-hydrolase [Bacillaceae bacterium]
MVEVFDHGPVKVWHIKFKILGQFFQSCVYLLDGLLIDTGPARFQNQLSSFYREHGVEQVVLTHHHEDHSGTAGWIARNMNIPIYAHRAGLQNLASPAKLPFYRKKVWGNCEPVQALPMSDEVETERFRLSVIYSPGHSHDHVALLDADNGRLFAGDLFLGRRIKYILRHENVPVLIRSLETVLKQDFDTLFCGHSGVVLSGKQALKSKYDYLTELREQVRSLRSQGYSIGAINRRLFGFNLFQEVFTGGEASSRHIVRSILQDDEEPNITDKGEHMHGHHV